MAAYFKYRYYLWCFSIPSQIKILKSQSTNDQSPLEWILANLQQSEISEIIEIGNNESWDVELLERIMQIVQLRYPPKNLFSLLTQIKDAEKAQAIILSKNNTIASTIQHNPQLLPFLQRITYRPFDETTLKEKFPHLTQENLNKLISNESGTE